MTRRKRGCLIALGAAAFLVAAALIAIWLMFPGDLRFGAPATSRDAAGGAPVSGGSGEGGDSGGALSSNLDPDANASRAGAWVTYLVPDEILQSEVKKAFPVQTTIVDLVRLNLDHPRFFEDPDGRFLRVRLDLQARILEDGEVLPGYVVVRSQLEYDRAARRVMLRNAQLMDLSFSGANAQAASALEPVLSAALASELDGYVIFEVPADGVWWLKSGVGLVRDVYVSDGRVAIGLGP